GCAASADVGGAAVLALDGRASAHLERLARAGSQGGRRGGVPAAVRRVRMDLDRSRSTRLAGSLERHARDGAAQEEVTGELSPCPQSEQGGEQVAVSLDELFERLEDLIVLVRGNLEDPAGQPLVRLRSFLGCVRFPGVVRSRISIGGAVLLVC